MGTLYFTRLFIFFFCCFFFFLESPYQAATNPAFSGLLGPRGPFQKILWEPKVGEAGPLVCILKNARMYCKKQGIGPFWHLKNLCSPPPGKSVFQKMPKRRTTCKNAGIMAFFGLILKK